MVDAERKQRIMNIFMGMHEQIKMLVHEMKHLTPEELDLLEKDPEILEILESVDADAQEVDFCPW